MCKPKLDKKIDMVLDKLRCDTVNVFGQSHEARVSEKAKKDARQAIKDIFKVELDSLVKRYIDKDYAVDTDELLVGLCEWIGDLEDCDRE